MGQSGTMWDNNTGDSLSAMILLFFETTSLVMRPFGMAVLDRLFQSDRLLAVSLLTLLVAA